ncbi:MAG: hypothetical protein CVU51_00500 [Deltaproteobacteria bacterium HGW-Deltaproteobacteria-1]|jgi:hypothetical protein|nr:MAG: hypothetical protein CVU51_00500 [Deltaproteobacteria bacterium HGW-Deltaproteobacteria-1]
MTPIESIYEIKEAVIDLQKYLNSKDRIVSKRAKMRYEQWVDRFFRENKHFVKLEQRISCLDDPACFLKLMDSAIEYYDGN